LLRLFSGFLMSGAGEPLFQRVQSVRIGILEGPAAASWGSCEAAEASYSTAPKDSEKTAEPEIKEREDIPGVKDGKESRLVGTGQDLGDGGLASGGTIGAVLLLTAPPEVGEAR